MRRFCSQVETVIRDRTLAIRFRSSPNKKISTVIFPLGLLGQQRNYQSYPQQTAYPPPPYPPPPPQQGMPYPYQTIHQVAPNFAGNRGTSSGYLGSVVPELGTKERPIVVVSAPQKSSWTTRLWMLLLIGIGLSCALSLIDELSARLQESSATPKSGGVSRVPLAGMFGSSEVRPVDLSNLDVTFESICGCDEAKGELQEIVDFLKDPEKFHYLGGRLPKGVLLVGPPGCGKTMLAKAIAKEAGVSFFYAVGSEFDEMFVGVGSRRVRDLFTAAKTNSPALIFIDEIDALGGKRSRSDHSYSRMTLNQLLAEMDGFDSKDSVIVIAATNTPEALDNALIRPGRFDTTVSVDPPDMKGRADVLQVYLDKVKVDSKVKAYDIARGTTGFTGAQLNNLVNIAAIRAAVLSKSAVTMEDVEYAKDRVMMGAESKKIIPEEERRVTAYHEGGHALAALLLENDGAEPVHKATIVPRGNGIMGLVQQLPKKDKYSLSKKQCLARLKVCLAGRVGEEILLGSHDVTTGASSDFQQATQMARNMVRRFGFNEELGFVDYESSETPEGAYMSDDTKRKIEKEVALLLQNSYKDIKDTLLSHKGELDSIAQNLLQYETLSGDELKSVVRGEILTPKIKEEVRPQARRNPPKGSEGMKGKRRPVAIS